MGCSSSSQAIPAAKTAAALHSGLCITQTPTYVFPHGTNLRLFSSELDSNHNRQATSKLANQASAVDLQEAEDDYTPQGRRIQETRQSKRTGSLSTFNVNQRLTNPSLAHLGESSLKHDALPSQPPVGKNTMYLPSEGFSSLHDVVQQPLPPMPSRPEDKKIKCFIRPTVNIPLRAETCLKEIPRCPMPRLTPEKKDQDLKSLSLKPGSALNTEKKINFGDASPGRKEKLRRRFRSDINILDKIRNVPVAKADGNADQSPAQNKLEGGSAGEPKIGQRSPPPSQMRPGFLDSPLRLQPSYLPAIESCEAKHLDMSDLFEVSDPGDCEIKNDPLSPANQDSPLLVPPLHKHQVNDQNEQVGKGLHRKSLRVCSNMESPEPFPKQLDVPLARENQVHRGVAFSQMPHEKECKSATVRVSKITKGCRGIKY